MNGMNLLERTFALACGMLIRQVVTTDRHRRLVKREKSFRSRYPKNTFRGLALRVGHHETGRLWSMYSNEKKVLRAASKLPEDKSPDMETRVLIRCLGEQLIIDAKSYLPEEARRLAHEWRSAQTAERQIVIAQEVTELFGVADQAESREEWLARLKNRSPEQFLLRFNHSSDLPRALNCLGKGQLVAAFAQLAGARTYCVNPVVDIANIRRQFDRLIRDQIKEDIKRRSTPNQYEGQLNFNFEETLLHSLDDDSREVEVHQYLDHQFHVAVALELRDGRWALIDPNYHCGVFSDQWPIENIDIVLREYGKVLPGLSILGNNMRETMEVFNTIWKEIYHYMHQTLHLELYSAFLVKGKGVEDDVINLALEHLDPHHPEMSTIRELAKLLGQDHRNRAIKIAEILALMEDKGDEADPAEVERLLNDPEYARRKITEIVTYAYVICINLMRRKSYKAFQDGNLIHPVCTFSLCSYSLALSVLCGVGNLLDYDWVNDSLFFDHSYDQLYLTNIVLSASSSGRLTHQAEARVEKAKKGLRSAYEIHPAAARALQSLDAQLAAAARK